MLNAIRKAGGARAPMKRPAERRSCAAAARRSRESPTGDDPAFIFDYETLRLIWWVLLGVLLIGFAVMDGFDLGVGALLPLVAQDRRRTPHRHQRRRPGLGRQPGLADPRRRRDLRRLAAALRASPSPASTWR